MSSYLDDGDNVVYTRYQRAGWKDELIVGLFKDMAIIRRATKWKWMGSQSSHGQEVNYTYFPNEVPRKCEFNHTLAAKAIECKAAIEDWLDTGVTFSTVDRQIDRGLSTCCVEVSSPKHNILAAKRTHQRLTLKF